MPSEEKLRLGAIGRGASLAATMTGYEREARAAGAGRGGAARGAVRGVTAASSTGFARTTGAAGLGATLATKTGAADFTIWVGRLAPGAAGSAFEASITGAG